MIEDEMIVTFLIVVLMYTQYNLWVVKKQLQLLQKSLEELREEK